MLVCVNAPVELFPLLIRRQRHRNALKVLISLAWLEKELYLWGVGMGSCTLPAGVLRGVSHRFLWQCASTWGPPRPSGAAVLGVLYSKSEFLAVLTYSNNMNGRRRMETGTANVTSFSPYSFKILGGCRGFHFLWGWGIHSHP